MNWDTVIGLEVHAQLQTKTKLFSGSPTTFGAEANSQTNFIDAGLPGVLPVLNRQAVIMAVQFGLAINADINDGSVFERKNYFYPDLPKGYQISQLLKPIVSNGSLSIHLQNGDLKQVIIERAHLEEDAGKSIHGHIPGYSAIDLNRAGTALLEIVTTPCLYSSDEVLKYLKTLHQLVQFLGICDGNMQEGSFRCDINISLKPQNSNTLGTRTELKNLNSFRFIEKAIAFEQQRQQDLLENGHQVIQETRLYNPDTNRTHAMREKELVNDYRYFPDPDLLPIQITRFDIAGIKNSLPSLPAQISKELEQIGTLHSDDIQFLLSSPLIYRFYKEVTDSSQAPIKIIVNWLKGTYSAFLNEHGLDFSSPQIPASVFAELMNKLHKNIINNNQARKLFEILWSGLHDIELILQQEEFAQKDDTIMLETLIQTVLTEFPQQVSDYKAGKTKLLAFFIGRIMKQTKGKANPELVSSLLEKKLSIVEIRSE